MCGSIRSTSRPSRISIGSEQKKNKAVKKEDKAGPSTVIPIESDSSGWDDSEEEFETLDDSDDSIKEEFWERLENDITSFMFYVVQVDSEE